MAARRKLSIEQSTRRDLALLPPHLRRSAPAMGMLLLACRVDSGASMRDTAAALRELRLTYRMLYDMAPPHLEQDAVDELRARREARMAATTLSPREDADGEG